MTSHNYKRPALYPETFKRLEYYRLDHDLDTPNEAITHLLDRIEEIEVGE